MIINLAEARARRSQTPPAPSTTALYKVQKYGPDDWAGLALHRSLGLWVITDIDNFKTEDEAYAAAKALYAELNRSR